MRRALAFGLMLLVAMVVSAGASPAGGGENYSGSGIRGAASGRVGQSQVPTLAQLSDSVKQAQGQEQPAAAVEQPRVQAPAPTPTPAQAQPSHEGWRSPKDSDWRTIHDTAALRKEPRERMRLAIMVHLGISRWVVHREWWTFTQNDGYWYARHPLWGTDLMSSEWFGLQNQFALYTTSDDRSTRSSAESIIAKYGGTILWSGRTPFGYEYIVSLGGHDSGPLPTDVAVPTVLGQFMRQYRTFVAVAPLAPDMYGELYYDRFYDHFYGNYLGLGFGGRFGHHGHWGWGGWSWWGIDDD